MERGLAAILAADVVGFSKLVQDDEAATLRRLKAIWDQVFAAQISGHRGRIFKLMGDGLLAEFSSVVDAVDCAAAIQTAMGDGGTAFADGAPIEFRIGVNLGGLLIDGEDVLGDGVNVAVRLEAAAPPGGALVSDHVHSQVRGKVKVSFADSGEIALKNIDAPLRAWSWQPAAARTKAKDKAPAPERERLLIAVLPFNNM